MVQNGSMQPSIVFIPNDDREQKPWPALLGTTFDEILPAISNLTERAQAALELINHDNEDLREVQVAYFFGKKTPLEKRTLLIADDEVPNLRMDFFSNLQKLKISSTDLDWQLAVKDSINWCMKSHGGGDNVQEVAVKSPGGMLYDVPAKPCTADSNCHASRRALDTQNSKTSLATEFDGAIGKKSFPPKSQISPRKTRLQERERKILPTRLTDTRSTRKRKTTNHDDFSMSPNRDQLTTARSGTIDAPSRIEVTESPPEHLSKKLRRKQNNVVKNPKIQIRKNDDWKSVWGTLQREGWSMKKGDLFITYYIPKKYKDRKIEWIISDLKMGKDYFTSEQCVKSYIHERYGWVGPKGNEFVPDAHKNQNRNCRSRVNDAITNSNDMGSTIAQTVSRSKGKVTDGSDRMKTRSSPTPNPQSTKKIAVAKALEVGRKIEAAQNDPAKVSLKERLNECSKSLHDSYSPEQMLFDGEKSISNYSSTGDRILSFFKSCANASGRNCPSFLYICGRPGTGKTTMVKHCSHIFTEANKQTTPTKIVHSFVKATDIVSDPKQLFNIVGRMIDKENLTDPEKLQKALSSGQKKSNIVLIIDEIDFLWKPQNKKNGEESALDTLLRWASLVDNRLALIGISNSVGDYHAKCIHNSIKIYDEIVFGPLTVDDLREIIKKRLGRNISLVDEKAITFISRKIANSKGDAREALQLTNDTIKKATESLSSETLSQYQKLDSSVVKISHVMQAARGSVDNSTVKIIENLPQNVKVVLSIATSLGQVSSAWKFINLRNLKRYCNEASGDILQNWSQSMFNDAIEQLGDAGLIKYEETDEVYDDLGDKFIQVGVQLEDVEIALQDSLLKEDNFYGRLVEHVKKIDIEQADFDEYSR